MESLFKNWRERCSSLGHLMTNLPSAEDKQKMKDDIKSLENERDLGINSNGNKVKWTDTKSETLIKLKEKLNTADDLPQGAKTHLDNVFRDIFWKRKRFLHNKYLTKGTINEDDGLDLISEAEPGNNFYGKNKKFFENDFICGTPDNIQSKVRDIKCSWDMETFDKAELTSTYEWQIKGYLYLTKLQEGELCYCLVNTPLHLLINEKNSLIYKLGNPEDTDDKWINAVSQLERNMIFDIQKFKINYQSYDFENTVLDFDIPAICRVKRFGPIVLLPEDIKNIKTRITLAREYLINKEKEVLTQINSVK